VRPGRDDLVDAGFLVLLGVLALIGFRTTYTGLGFLVVGVTGLLLGIVVGHAANAVHQPVITVAALTVAVFFLLGGAIALRAQALAGVLPTPDTLRGLAQGSVLGWKRLLTTLPPVDGSGPLLVIPYILGLCGGAGGFTLARRVSRSAVPLVVPLALLAAVILLGTEEPAAQLLQGVVFGCACLCWAAVRGRRGRTPVRSGSARTTRLATSAAVLGVAAGLTALAGPHLPGAGDHERVVLRDHVQPPVDLSAYPSPLVGFRKYTKDANQLYDQVLFTVTGLPDGAPVRIATLDDYTGSVWAATNGPRDGFQRVGSRIQPDSVGRQANVTITVAPAYATSDDLSAWLPTAGTVTAVDFAGAHAAEHAETFRFNLATSSGLLADRLHAGDSVTLRTDLASPTAPEDAQPFGHPALDPSSFAFVSSRATSWSKKATGLGPQLRAVAAYLKANGAYTDGGPGESEYLAGHSAGRLTSFLNAPKPVGDDEQYAATFALIANALGMPARVVLGAYPRPGGEVRGEDVHAWVEIHLADGTWAPIPQTDFMPDKSKKPDKQPPQEIQNTNAAVVPPPNTTHPPSSLTDASQADSTSTPRGPQGQGSGWHLPRFLVVAATWAGPPVLLVLLVAGLIIGAKAWRRRIRRGRGPAATRFATGWRELVDHARDLGTAVPGGRTRREQSRILAGYRIGDLAATADAIVFGPGEPAHAAAAAYWASVDRARRRMSREVPRWQRLRAAVSIRSLRAAT
jgi:hypothetical protein